MEKFILGLVLILGTSAGFIHWQGLGTMTLSMFFGATDGVQTFMEANPANPHPSVRLTPSERR